MSGRSPLKFDPEADGTLFSLFTSLFLLFVVLGLLRMFNRRVLFEASYAVRSATHPALVGTAVYAATGLVILSAAVVLWRARRPPDQRARRGRLLRYGGVAALSLIASAYLLHRSLPLPVFPRELLIGVSNGLVVMGLLTVRYTRARGIDLPLSVPDRADWATALGVSLLAALTALGGTYGYVRTVEQVPQMRFDRPAMGGVWPVELVLSGVFLGVGLGLLFHGTVQTGLRDRLGTAGGVTATAALSGFPLVVASTLDVSTWELRLLPAAGLVVAENYVLVVSALALVQGSWLLATRAGVELTPVLGATAIVVGAVLVSLAIEEPAAVPRTVSWAVVAALATVGFERSRSVWVPVAAYASYLLFAPVEVVRLLLPVSL